MRETVKQRQILRDTWFRAPLIASVLLLTNCSDSAVPGQEDRAEIVRRSERETTTMFPPGSAAPLSIVGVSQGGSSDPLAAAVECTVAVRATARLLTSMPQTGEAERNALKEAEVYFRKNAETVAQRHGQKLAAVEAALESRSRVTQANPASQVQLALACLRRVPAGR